MKRRILKEKSDSDLNETENLEKNDRNFDKILQIITIFLILIVLFLLIILMVSFSNSKFHNVLKANREILVIKNRSDSSQKPKRQESCGISYYENRIPLLKIINGMEANPHSQPWIISLRSISSPGFLSNHVCGGSLISDQHVLTAAHCVTGQSSESVAILVGLHNLNEVTKDNYYSVENIWIHESYTGENGDYIANDLAVIKLDRPIERSDKVQPICLPTPGENAGQTDLIASGWGNMFDGFDQVIPDNLQTTKLRVINGDPICDSNGEWYSKSVLCTIDPSVNQNSNVCFGDSGGPLTREKNGLWTLYGVTSYVMVKSDDNGRYRCSTEKPSYFTEVSMFIDWINEKIQL